MHQLFTRIRPSSLCIFIQIWLITCTLLSVHLLGAAELEDKKEAQGIVILLLGPPGSGKGTQAIRLSKALNLPHISTGDLFRENINQETEVGKKAREYLESGKLVPDSIVLKMLFNRIEHADCSTGFLLDGFPRRKEQAEALTQYLPSHFRLFVINFKVNDTILIHRAEGRLICQQCGRVYHKKFSPPKTSMQCDICNNPLIQRIDDSSEVVKKRLEVYNQFNQPVLDYYKERGSLIEVNGERSPEEIFEALQNIVQEKANKNTPKNKENGS